MATEAEPDMRDHIWSDDFVEAQTNDGHKLRLMTLIDEFTRECGGINYRPPAPQTFVPSISIPLKNSVRSGANVWLEV